MFVKDVKLSEVISKRHLLELSCDGFFLMSERKHVEVCECPSMWYGKKEMEIKISKSFCLSVNVQGMGMTRDAGSSRAFIRFFRFLHRSLPPFVPFDRLLPSSPPSGFWMRLHLSPFVPSSLRLTIFLLSLLHNWIDLLSSLPHTT